MQPDEARRALRGFLLSQAANEVSGHSISDALALICKQPSRNRLVAIVLLRCLAANGVVPSRMLVII